MILGQFPCFFGIFHIKPFDRPIFLNYPENLHQEQLANRAEMGAAHLGNIERGSSRNNPTLKTLHKIASALETTLEKLFENTGGNPKDFDTEEKEPAWMKGSR